MYEKIELDVSYDFEISNILPAYEFDSGKSYVIGLEIPTYYKSLKLEINSYFDNNLFYPNITILDDHYYVIKSVSHKSIKYENVKKFGSAYLSGYFDINETEDSAKYILIYTTDELQKFRIIVNPGSRSGYDVHAGPEGKIRINLKSD
ncbi:MAG: MalM family protein [Gammaproteobacteria bacterium]|nr:MalM family protein [Gammaproteobacteria bacterium]